MSELILKEPYPAVFIKPEDAGLKLGLMGDMYGDDALREKYTDGMDLMRAVPEKPYQEIVSDYTDLRRDGEVSAIEFFENNFDMPEAVEVSHKAEPGQPIKEYVEAKLLKLMKSKDDQGHFGIGLPEDHPAAGVGRFAGESYHWDNWPIILAYARMGEWDKVASVLYNVEYEINKYGHHLNGSSEMYATRAQPDYFSHMIRLLADEFGPEVLVRFLPALEKSHTGYWMDGSESLPNDGEVHTHRALVRMPDGSFLNRYHDDGEGPRPESYWEDMKTAEAATEGLEGEEREIAMKLVFKNIRAAAASGWDFSSRWFKDGKNLSTICTTEIAPIDLNSLLVHKEQTLAMQYLAAAEMGGTEEYSEQECIERADKYADMALQRKAAIDKYLWDDEDKIYRDYNFVDGKQTDIVSAATAYPLYVGIANREQTLGVADAIENQLLTPGGVAVSTTMDSGEQWDGKNVWAPPQDAVVRGLAASALKLLAQGDSQAEKVFQLAEKTRDNFQSGVKAYFNSNGTVPEKINGANPKKPAGGGEYDMVKLLGMTLGAFLDQSGFEVRKPKTVHEGIGRLAIKQALRYPANF